MPGVVQDSLTIHECIAALAESAPNAAAIVAPGAQPLTFADLVEHADYVHRSLNAAGIDRGDRVGLVLPNGPELAACFLCVATCATSAPLNPSYTTDEFAFYLSDLRVKALIALAGGETPARVAAEQLGVPVIDLLPQPGAPAGSFRLGAAHSADALHGGPARSTDSALVLHTSGTTARPKIVALSQTNLTASARNIAAWFTLETADRCLNVMPLFHVHGLVAGVLSPLISGGSTICLGDFEAEAFFGCMVRLRPTWYTSVPTVHRAVLTQSADHRDAVKDHNLRFIRSSSTSLPPQLMNELEELFEVPVVESYSMTEASHQMTSNPLPPGQRRPGSVGIPAGAECVIMDQAGRLLPRGETGEVVARGPGVFSGYENNPEANASAFTNGWFRTGDEGRFDADGYLTLTGRLKEVIDRGGEKVSPLEVDQVLLAHGDVKEAVCFAMPHHTLGEEVAAAVVLGPGTEPEIDELRAFAGRRLAPYKVPRKIVVLDKLPKGPTGKVERIGLAERLGLGNPIRTDREGGVRNGRYETVLRASLAGLWKHVLRVKALTEHDDFFLLGGDSLQAGRLVAEVAAMFGVDLPLKSVFDEASTIGGMAEAIERGRTEGGPSAVSSISRGSREGAVPASYAQQSFWVLSRIFRGEPIFNVACAFRIRGRCDVAKLEVAMSEIVRRHEAMRTTLIWQDDQLLQRIAEPEPVRLKEFELAGVTLEEREQAAMVHARRIAQQSFDLAVSPSARMSVLRLNATDRVLVIVLHHALADGWSREILFSDLSALFGSLVRDRPPILPTLELRYTDFAIWQRQCWRSGAYRQHLDYWRGKLDGASLKLSPLTPGPRPKIQDWHSQLQKMVLPSEVERVLRSLGGRHQATFFMTLLAAFKAWLYLQTSETDVIVGVPIANRPIPEMGSVVGCFVNLLPFRTDLSGDPSFNELLERIRTVAIEAYEHQSVPVEKLVEQALPEQQLAAEPLTPVIFQSRSYQGEHRFTLNDLVIEHFDFDPGMSPFDLSVDWAESEVGLVCSFVYKPDLLDEARVTAMMEAYCQVLETVAENPQVRLSQL